MATSIPGHHQKGKLIRPEIGPKKPPPIKRYKIILNLSGERPPNPPLNFFFFTENSSILNNAVSILQYCCPVILIFILSFIEIRCSMIRASCEELFIDAQRKFELKKFDAAEEVYKKIVAEILVSRRHFICWG